MHISAFGSETLLSGTVQKYSITYRCQHLSKIASSQCMVVSSDGEIYLQ